MGGGGGKIGPGAVTDQKDRPLRRKMAGHGLSGLSGLQGCGVEVFGRQAIAHRHDRPG